MKRPSIHQPLHPVTAWCRECDWRWEGHSRSPLLTEPRDAAAREHARTTGHAAVVSMPGYPGYEAIGPE